MQVLKILPPQRQLDIEKKDLFDLIIIEIKAIPNGVERKERQTIVCSMGDTYKCGK